MLKSFVENHSVSLLLKFLSKCIIIDGLLWFWPAMVLGCTLLSKLIFTVIELIGILIIDNNLILNNTFHFVTKRFT